jgi:hypothetical protein
VEAVAEVVVVVTVTPAAGPPVAISRTDATSCNAPTATCGCVEPRRVVDAMPPLLLRL